MKEYARAGFSGTVTSVPVLSEKGSLTYEIEIATRTAKIKVGVLAKGDAAKRIPAEGDYVFIPCGEIYISREKKDCSFSVFIKEECDIFICARDDGFVNAESVL